MSKHQSRLALAPIATLHAAPTTAGPVAVEVQRTFDLPVALHAATVALYFAFIGVMALAFMNPELAIPFVIFAVFLVGAFGVPTMWARMRPANSARRITAREARTHGIDVLTGRLTYGEAAGQVLVLPVLLLFWACAVAVIAALVL